MISERQIHFPLIIINISFELISQKNGFLMSQIDRRLIGFLIINKDDLIFSGTFT